MPQPRFTAVELARPQRAGDLFGRRSEQTIQDLLLAATRLGLYPDTADGVRCPECDYGRDAGLEFCAGERPPHVAQIRYPIERAERAFFEECADLRGVRHFHRQCRRCKARWVEFQDDARATAVDALVQKGEFHVAPEREADFHGELERLAVWTGECRIPTTQGTPLQPRQRG